MLAFRSRQFAYENTFALWTLLGSAALCAVLFTVADAWAQAPWLCWGVLALLVGLLAVPLTITVDASHVRVSLAGVSRRDIAFGDIVAVERREYRALREFGGWGSRSGITHRNARLYSTTGSTAVVLSLRSSEEVYLGVDNDAALLEVLASRIGS
jgi:hypothetical protein